MRIHKNARLTPILRAELARRVIQDLFPLSTAAAEFNVSSKTAAKWIRRFRQDGAQGLLDRTSRPHRSPQQLSPERSDDECKGLLISILHRPPLEFGINRSSWRIVDLHRVLREHGMPLSGARMQRVFRMTGFKWRKARVALTSTDPECTQKVKAIKEVLAGLQADEAFFSIDEYGPFSIKKKGDRKRVGPEGIIGIYARARHARSCGPRVLETDFVRYSSFAQDFAKVIWAQFSRMVIDINVRVLAFGVGEEQHVTVSDSSHRPSRISY
jgi:transposase